LGQLFLNKVQKFYGDFEVLKSVQLDVKNGEFVVFVGPSGCGKSTLLRMIAGLDETSAGDIVIDGVRVNDLPPVKRGIAMVFQSYALYPHMTVFENIAFPLRVEKMEEEKLKAKVENAARILHLDQRLQQKPGMLSGGQRQRVAIGRAIVREPKIFLFDEPLSNLDAALRADMRIELAKLHRQLKATMIYVTHDQVEAMTMADRIVVLECRRYRPDGRAARALSQARQHLRCRLHRQSEDELPAGHLHGHQRCRPRPLITRARRLPFRLRRAPTPSARR
jgi:multiple sugar transport system ATP-binding protein